MSLVPLQQVVLAMITGEITYAGSKDYAPFVPKIFIKEQSIPNGPIVMHGVQIACLQGLVIIPSLLIPELIQVLKGYIQE